MRSSIGRRTSAVAVVVVLVPLLAGALAIGGPTETAAGAPTRAHEAAHVDLPPSPADPQRPITDPALVAGIRAAGALRTGATRALSPGVLPVEVLTSFDAAVAARVEALGGTVTGTVPGEVVQADIPPAIADELALSDGVEFVQAARLVNHRPQQPEASGFGANVNAGVAAMNAAAWHEAGYRGAGVRVGIVDFFRTSLWNPVEHGPVPTVGNGHQFCLDSMGVGLCNADGSINSVEGDQHGVAVAELVKDAAPAADVFIATVATVSDLRAAIDWFAASGVSVMTRSLGSAYDGPGDGTGPLDAVVDYAASRGLTWFNSAGNDAGDGYMKVIVAATNGNNEVEFTEGDHLLRLDSASSTCFQLDGIRWANDWYLPPAQRTDYRVEVYEPTNAVDVYNVSANPAALRPVDLYPSTPGTQNVSDADQRGGAAPLEMADEFWCTVTGVSYLRIVRNPATPVGPVADVLEISSTFRDLEYVAAPAGSASKPVVDSRNPALIAVGALDAPSSSNVAHYSSQGPTTDGRIKPDVVAPSCVITSIYGPICFAGTSASAPAAAGFAALLLGAGLAVNGAPLVALVEHLTVDIAAPGPDNASGNGRIMLPDPPTAPVQAEPGQYNPISPARILDTRPTSPIGPANLIGAKPEHGIIDLAVIGGAGVPAYGVAAVAVNITSVDSTATHYIEAQPTMRGKIGSTSTLNVSVLGQPRPNFAIVPVGAGGKISLYMPAGGNVVVDMLGYFAPAVSASSGRFVPIQPERWMDTREPGPYPLGVSAMRKVGAAETVAVGPMPGSAVPAVGVAALVLNVTSDDSTRYGFLRVLPTGAGGLDNSTLNYLTGQPSANTSIVPVGSGGTISVFALQPTHVIVDVVGYITSDAAPPSDGGLFVALTPGRNFDSRNSGSAFPRGSTHDIVVTQVAAPAATVPASASAISGNLTSDQGAATGFVRVTPMGGTAATTSNLNFAAGAPVANALLMKLGAGGGLSLFVNQQTHAIIDVNGYFTGP